MKKIIFVLFMAVVLCGSADAQKKMQGFGVNVASNYFEFGTGGGVGLKYQYNISDYIRIEPAFTYYTTISKDYYTEICSLLGVFNCDIFLSKPRTARPYVFLGVGYVGFRCEDYYGSSIQGSLGSNMGLGFDWRMSHKLSLQIEAGALFVSDDGYGDSQFGGILNIGCSYNF